MSAGHAADPTSSFTEPAPSLPSAGSRPSVVGRVLIALIGAWRWTSAWRAPRCRFTPTCSAYALESIRLHGAVRGGWRALRRLARCHPWNPGGVDPVS